MTSKTPTSFDHTHQQLIHQSKSFDNAICNNNNNVIEQATIDYLKVKANKKLYKSESKEDIISEAGTYTIEIDHESPTRKPNGVNIEVINDDLELRKAAIEQTFGINLLNNNSKQNSNSNTNIEFLIDECRPQNLVTSSYGNLQDYENDDSENMQLINNNGTEEDIDDDAESFNKNNLNKSSTSNTSNSNSSSSSNRKAKKYSSRIKKTLTYDIIKNDDENQNNLSINIDEDDDSSHVNSNNKNSGGDDTEGLSERTAATGNTTAAMSLCTDVLLGDTNELINKLNEKKQQIRARTKSHQQSATPPKLNFGSETTRTEEIEKFSTRAIVNDSELFNSNHDDMENIDTVDSVTSDEFTEYDDDSQRDGSHRGGLAFHVDIARTTSLPPQANAATLNTTKQTAHHYIYELKRPRSKTETASNISSSTSNLTKSVNNTQMTEQSLGAKIQQKAKQNANQLSPQHQQQQPLKSIIRRSSLNDKNATTASNNAAAVAATNNPTMTSSAILSNNLQMQTNRTLYLRQQSAKAKREALNNTNSNQPPFTVPIATNTTTKPRSANSASTTRRSVDTQHSYSSATSTARSKNTQSSLSASSKLKPNSRSQSPSVVSQPQSILSAVNNQQHTAAREAFHRRKNYDPLKAVEDEKIKRKLKQQPSQTHYQESYPHVTGTSSQAPIITTTTSHTATPSSHSHRLKSQSQEESPNSLGSIDSVSSSVCNDLSVPIEKLKTNISNKQTYETLLKSTVQRLCIRLIQMSTSVLDKIGNDQSTSKLNDDAIKLGNNELERMQNLAKLVHSMQLVNEHVQTIDSTLFSANKPDERYLNLA